jgi:hypothetical protein
MNSSLIYIIMNCRINKFYQAFSEDLQLYLIAPRHPHSHRCLLKKLVAPGVYYIAHYILLTLF